MNEKGKKKYNEKWGGDSSTSGQGAVAVSCEQGNIPSGPTECWEFLK
jgi:hypothetical protein